MATITVTENARGQLYPSVAFATHTFTITQPQIVLSSQKTQVDSKADAKPTVQVKYSTSAGGRTRIADTLKLTGSVALPSGTTQTWDHAYERRTALSANTNAVMPYINTIIPATTVSIDSLFNSSNPTTKSIPIVWKASNYFDDYVAGTQDSQEQYVAWRNGSWESSAITEGAIVLDAPPTFDVSALSIDTASAYAGATTASVTISNLSAKYGGSITEVKLTIGNQTAIRTDNGTLSIALGAVGTFTPTVTVTDSRGQVTTQTLEAITVGDYTSPSVSIAVQRTLATGVPNDEGEYGTISATFEFVDAIAQLTQPTVTVDGTSATVTWYSTRATDGTLSGTVNWASLTSLATVYGIVSAPNIQTSYQIEVTPNDSISSGTPISQTLASAFYTIDFLAGGHGIAFGQPASRDGFECNMPTTFHDTVTMEDTVSVMDANSTLRALFDFIHPVGSYYETSDTSFNPNTTWGGTWVLETEGQVHISAGSNYAVSGALTNTSDGGEETHTLTVDEMPSHSHNPANGTSYAFVETNADSTLSRRSAGGSTTSNYITSTQAFYRHTATNSKGGGQAHNIMQPYIVVNRWHRTA